MRCSNASKSKSPEIERERYGEGIRNCSFFEIISFSRSVNFYIFSQTGPSASSGTKIVIIFRAAFQGEREEFRMPLLVDLCTAFVAIECESARNVIIQGWSRTISAQLPMETSYRQAQVVVDICFSCPQLHFRCIVQGNWPRQMSTSSISSKS